jgi:hypothetical protein
MEEILKSVGHEERYQGGYRVLERERERKERTTAVGIREPNDWMCNVE